MTTYETREVSELRRAEDRQRAEYDLRTRVSPFVLHARDTSTGETRDLTVYAKDAAGAYAQGWVVLDREKGDRSWCFDGFTKEDLA